MSLTSQLVLGFQRVGQEVKKRGVPVGGTAGQQLLKASATDYASQWSTPPLIIGGDFGGDWNTLTVGGIYRCTASSSTNGPGGYQYGMITVTVNNGWIMQQFVPDQVNEVGFKIRTNFISGWSAWKRYAPV